MWAATRPWNSNSSILDGLPRVATIGLDRYDCQATEWRDCKGWAGRAATQHRAATGHEPALADANAPWAPFEPPHPRSLPAVIALVRAMMEGEGNLLGLLPAEAYRMPIGPLGWSRRSTIIVNRPDLVRHVLADPEGIFPKSDLMVEALDPLIGDSSSSPPATPGAASAR